MKEKVHCFTKDRVDKGCEKCRFLNHCIPYGEKDMPDYFDTFWEREVRTATLS